MQRLTMKAAANQKMLLEPSKAVKAIATAIIKNTQHFFVKTMVQNTSLS